MTHSQSHSDKIAVRLDKWLWAARFYKTRSLARDMIDGGKVHYNGQRSKPSKIVEIGATIRLRQGSDSKEIRILALAEKRGPANYAATLYEESAQSISIREETALLRKASALAMPNPERRPTKKERRDLLKFKHDR